MRKIFSMILAMMLISTGTINSFANTRIAESELEQPSEEIEPIEGSMDSTISKEKLQDILIDIKKRIIILDEDAKLNYSMGASSGNTYYELTWERESDVQTVQYGEDQNIYYYNHYQLNTEMGYWNTKKLPQYSMDESETIAKDFIQKALPTEYSNFVLSEKPSTSLDSYSFYFKYYKNDIPVIGVDANVIVNYITGDVTNFNTSYSSGIEFEESSGAISQEKAEDSFQKEIGLRKIYTYTMQENNADNVRMAYTTGVDSRFALNAKTGKREWVGYYGSIYYGKAYAEDSAGIQPLEQAEIDAKSKLQSMNEAAKAAQKLGLFPTKGVEMSYANLYERNDTSSGYLWALEFVSETETYRVELDAMSLELIGFYDYSHYGNYQSISQKNLDAAKKSAEEFIKKYFANDESKIKLNAAELEAMLQRSSDTVTVVFERYEGDAFLLEDSITLGFSPSSEKIVSARKQWHNIRLPKPTKFADEKVVYDKIFTENTLQLVYQLQWSEQKQRNEAKLFYSIMNEEELPLRFAVTTGERILPVDRTEKIETYRDLDNSKFQEEAQTLLQIGIGFAGGELKPNIPITKLEWLKLISMAFSGSYFGEMGTTDENQLRYWRQIGLILENEKVEDNPIAREEVVKYLVRALGYQKIAAKPEIFKSELYDFDKVSTELKGYVAIGDALRILDVTSGGEFFPNELATRDQSIKMLYNFLAFQ